VIPAGVSASSRPGRVWRRLAIATGQIACWGTTGILKGNSLQPAPRANWLAVLGPIGLRQNHPLLPPDRRFLSAAQPWRNPIRAKASGREPALVEPERRWRWQWFPGLRPSSPISTPGATTCFGPRPEQGPSRASAGCPGAGSDWQGLEASLSRIERLSGGQRTGRIGPGPLPLAARACAVVASMSPSPTSMWMCGWPRVPKLHVC